MSFFPPKGVALVLLTAVSPYLFAQPFMNQPAGLVTVDASANPIVYTTVGGTIFRFGDDGATWNANHILPAGGRQPIVTALAADPAIPGLIYAGTAPGEGTMWKSTDGGRTWTPANQGLPVTAVVESIHIPRTNPATVYAKIGFELYKSTDRGATWVLQSTLPPDITAFAISPINPTLMFAGRSVFLFRSEDEGVTWEIKGLVNVTPPSGISTIAPDPVNPNIVFAGARGTGSGNGIFFSGDRGLSFIRILNGRPAQITYHPTRPAILFSSELESACVDRSENGGANWTRTCLGNGAGGVRLAFSPAVPDQIWAASIAGMSRSDDAGKTWDLRGGNVRPTLLVPQANYDFSLSSSQQGHTELGIRIVEDAGWSIPVTVTTSGEPWLTLTGLASSPFTSANGVVRVNPTGLAPGTHRATIRLTSAQANNSPIEIPVQLTVTAAAGTPQWAIDTYAGNGQIGTFGDNGPAVSAAFTSLDSLAVDALDGLLISDPQTHRIRRISSDGIIRRFAGTGQAASSGDGGDPLLAGLRDPSGLAVAGGGSILIGDTSNGRIREISAGVISTKASFANLQPRGVAAGPDGSVYFAAPAAHVVVRIPSMGAPVVFAGTGTPGYRGDNVRADTARLSSPTDVAVDAAGNVYIADTDNHRIRVVGTDGIIHTYAGNGAAGFQGEAADAARGSLSRPTGVGLDEAGNLYIADSENHRIRMVTPQRALRTLAGTGEIGFEGDGGPALSARMRLPLDVAADTKGNVFVADSLNRRIRRLYVPPPVTPPEVSEGGVVNPFDYTPRLAPGTLFSIFGSNFAAVEQAATAAPLPTILRGVTVTVNGRLAPLLYAGPTQINGQIPFETAPGQAVVVVFVNGIASQQVTITITGAAPAVLLAQNPNGSVNGEGSPAPSGTYVICYLVGQGPLDNAAATGTAAQANPLSRPLAAVSATIDGSPIKVLFLGMTPGFVGLAQANLELPTLTPGRHTIVITIGGVPSNPIELWVAQ